MLSTTTHSALKDVGRSKASLRFALDLALKTPSPLSADIISDTIELCDQVRAMFDARYSPLWFSNNIKKARESRPRNRRVEFDSSASDRSVEARRPRHCDEPTSGRGNSKRAMTALTTDSDSGPDSDWDNRPPRQVIPRVFHAPDPLGSTPSFPPRISRTRGTHRNDSLHCRPETRPTLGASITDRNHPSDESSNPHLTPQSLEMITAATIAALNQHLVNIVFFPRVDETPPDESVPPRARNAPTIPPISLPHLCDPAPGSVFPSSYPMNTAIHHLQDGSPPVTHNPLAHTRFSPDFVSKIQAEYRTLDTRRVPRVQPLQFSPHADRTAATQLLTQSMRDALSGIFDVADPSGSVTTRSPSWVSGWHAPLLKLTKASIVPNRDDTHTLHRLIDDLFAQLQEKLASGVDGPVAFRTLLTDVTDYFDRAPRGAALETLQKFGVPSGTPFSNYLRSFKVVVASTVDKGGPLAPSPEMAMELIRIRTAQQYPMLMPTLFPGILATREKPYDSLATLWTVFAHLKHNTSPAIDGDAFSSVSKSLSSYTHQVAATSNSLTTSPNRSMRRFGRQDTASGVSHISQTHSRRDPFADDYGLWPFDDRDYDIVCTVTNHILNTNFSFWTPLLSEDARRQACVQYKGRCCNCGSTEHSLRWCPAPLRSTFSILNPEFGTHDSDGSIFETWILRMRQWRQQTASRGRQGNQRRNSTSNHRSRYINNRGQNITYQNNPPGTARTHVSGDARYPPLRTTPAPQTPPMGHGPGTMDTRRANQPTHTTPHGQHNHTP